jgi:hypothetical protein
LSSPWRLRTCRTRETLQRAPRSADSGPLSPDVTARRLGASDRCDGPGESHSRAAVRSPARSCKCSRRRCRGPDPPWRRAHNGNRTAPPMPGGAGPLASGALNGIEKGIRKFRMRFPEQPRSTSRMSLTSLEAGLPQGQDGLIRKRLPPEPTLNWQVRR